MTDVRQNRADSWLRFFVTYTNQRVGRGFDHTTAAFHVTKNHMCAAFARRRGLSSLYSGPFLDPVCAITTNSLFVSVTGRRPGRDVFNVAINVPGPVTSAEMLKLGR